MDFIIDAFGYAGLFFTIFCFGVIYALIGFLSMFFFEIVWDINTEKSLTAISCILFHPVLWAFYFFGKSIRFIKSWYNASTIY